MVVHHALDVYPGQVTKGTKILIHLEGEKGGERERERERGIQNSINISKCHELWQNPQV